ncbi:hypothetical protein [Streptomyces yerevanensis]|uniref:hypothetical protein n=1 Tax=Streptomyces yerevanensis TaxID=66378 RepID=UPI00052487CD|nr:hypothetical protein [Streptomyces yerevanensis]
MADWLSAVVAVVSATVAVYAAYWARRSARGTFAHTAYELARTLHTDLTTGATAQARDVLEHFRSGTRYHEPGPDGLPPAAGTQEVLEAYFALLWCFERILIGRRSLTKQQDSNDTGPAVAFLDDLLAWHLKHWAERWPTMRATLKAHPAGYRICAITTPWAASVTSSKRSPDSTNTPPCCALSSAKRMTRVSA